MTCKLCDKKIHARGLCQSHYFKWYKYGDPFKEKRTRSLITKPQSNLREQRKADTLAAMGI